MKKGERGIKIILIGADPGGLAARIQASHPDLDVIVQEESVATEEFLKTYNARPEGPVPFLKSNPDKDFCETSRAKRRKAERNLKKKKNK